MTDEGIDGMTKTLFFVVEPLAPWCHLHHHLGQGDYLRRITAGNAAIDLAVL